MGENYDEGPEPEVRRGRPPFEPTDELRAQVLELVAQGKPETQIAAAIGLALPTLRAHFADELAAPRPQLNFSFCGNSETKRRSLDSDRMGRPPHVPTKKSRTRVEVLVAGGMSQSEIAAALKISVPTLCEHYASELRDGRARRRAAVIEAQFRCAVEGNVAAQKAFLDHPGQADFAVPEAPTKEPPLGKKQQQQEAAEEVAQGRFAPPAAPKLVVSND